MGVLQYENLFRQGGEAQQQPNGDKAGDQRRKDGGEFGEKLLHRAGLLALQRLLFSAATSASVGAAAGAASSRPFIISAAVCALPGPSTTGTARR